MPVADAAKAIAALNDKEYQQRTLKVREANDKRDGMRGKAPTSTPEDSAQHLFE